MLKLRTRDIIFVYYKSELLKPFAVAGSGASW